MNSHFNSGTDPRRQLPPALQLRILTLLPPNERALSGRLTCRDAADAFSAAEDRTVSLAHQLPPHAVPWALEAGQRHVRLLPFRHKFHLLSTAASSGSKVNLGIALKLLQPSIFPELLHSPHCSYCSFTTDPGVAAVKAGHLQLLSWLLSHCPGLLSPGRVLEAAAQHCDLAGLQQVWEALQSWPADSSSGSGGLRAALSQYVLDAAAGSATPDAVAKMEWVLATTAGARCRLNTRTAIAAARSGDLTRLRWLREQGCQLVGGNWNEHTCFLAEATLEAAQWLVDEAGCGLPRAAAGTGQGHLVWGHLLFQVAHGRDGLAKLRWLQGRRPPQLHGDWEGENSLLVRLVQIAAGAGQLKTVQSLVRELELLPDGKGALGVDPNYAAGSGSVPVAAYLHGAGRRFSFYAYMKAAEHGHLAMVRWLAQEAGVSAEGLDLSSFIKLWPECPVARSRGLLQAVQLLVGVAGCRGWDAELALSLAAERGGLALVQYLQELGQQQQVHAQEQQGQGQGQQGQVQGPGQQGQLPPVAWHDGWMVRDAAEAGCEALLEWWLVERHGGCHVEGTSQGLTNSAHLCAAKAADRGTLSALRRLGVPWGTEDVVVRAVGHWCQLPVLRWLVEQGAPVGSTGDMEEAVAHRVRGGGLSAEEAAWLRGLAGAVEAAAVAATKD